MRLLHVREALHRPVFREGLGKRAIHIKRREEVDVAVRGFAALDVGVLTRLLKLGPRVLNLAFAHMERRVGQVFRSKWTRIDAPVLADAVDECGQGVVLGRQKGPS